MVEGSERAACLPSVHACGLAVIDVCPGEEVDSMRR